MTYLVTVTSQGQISIPADLRKKYDLSKNRTLILRDSEAGEISVKPIPDLLDLRGSLKTRKKVSSRQIREAFGNYLATRHIKRGNFPFPHVSP